jgi:hypothetical protein
MTAAPPLIRRAGVDPRRGLAIPTRCPACGRPVTPLLAPAPRPELVAAMGVQIKPGVGVSFKKGAGVIVADSSKPCCCTTATCPCSTCTDTGNTLVADITAVIDGLTPCSSCVTINTGFAGEYCLHCGFSISHPPPTTSTGCPWLNSAAVWKVNDGRQNDSSCNLGSPTIRTMNHVWIYMTHLGSGLLAFSVEIDIIVGGLTSSNVIFYDEQTTTVRNACLLETPITFTNNVETYKPSNGCAYGDEPIEFHGGTAVVSAGCA